MLKYEGCWRTGELENWRTGELENWRTGELENWRTGELENWRTGELENWRKFAGFEPGDNSCSLNYFVILKSEEREKWGSHGKYLSRRAKPHPVFQKRSVL
ncbi:hypothetical protein L1D14_02965 [Vibrio tubiashii]|uniref:hypothetical protein n=1 Tax=Vibrio tubiashii TaxID=29498 RepID=UPI001EFD05E6|nr:hypothetical protein [Vibrio tubiashii]MCG9575195.1 hypothetical protein [Vibrio tubiashii]